MLTACQGGSNEGSVSTEGQGSTQEPTGSIVLVKDGVCDYKIVVPNGDKDAVEAGYDLRTAFIRETGVKISVVKDTAEPTEKEILIGNTNRAESAAVCAKVSGADDYFLQVSGSKLVMAGGSVNAIALCAETLLKTCYSGGELRIPVTYSLSYTATYLELANGSSTEYVFVVSKANSKDYDLAYYLQSLIRTNTGVRIPIVYDTAAASGKEILLGSPNREEIAAVTSQFITELDYFVGAVGEKLVICGTTQDSLNKAVDWFIENCIGEKKSLTIQASMQHLSRPEGFEAIAMSINNKTEEGYITLNSLERVTVYDPSDPVNGWWYSHHAAITQINGVFIAVWSQGRRNEDDLGQRIAYSTSADFIHWTPSQPLVDSWMGTYSEMKLGCAGLYNNGEHVVVYFGASEYDPNSLRENGTLRPVEDGTAINHGRWCVTTTDGVNWTEPQLLSVSGGGHQGPILMDNGELLWAGGYNHAYTDDLSGLTWDGNARVDQDYAIATGGSGGVTMLVEGSFIVKDDVVYMFTRTGSDYLWVSFSTDWGRSWSLPMKTNFTDANTKFMFGKLPDGRFWCVSCPDPAGRANRTPLILHISEDGINWNEQYMLGNLPHVQEMPGMYKGGIYGYPNCFVGDDGYFYVIYSLHKEDIEVLRFSLAEIGVK